MATAVSFFILNAATVGGGVMLPPSSVITGIGFSAGAGVAEGALSLATTGDSDLSATGQVNPTILAVHVFDAAVSSNVFYDGLKIRLKDNQQLFISGLGGLSNAFILVKIETQVA